MKKPKEGDLVKAAIEYLRMKGVLCWRNQSGSVVSQASGCRVRMSAPGVSDIIGVLKDGRVLAVECKMKGREPTYEQLEFLASVKSRGGVAIVAYSVEEIMEVV